MVYRDPDSHTSGKEDEVADPAPSVFGEKPDANSMLAIRQRTGPNSNFVPRNFLPRDFLERQSDNKLWQTRSPDVFLGIEILAKLTGAIPAFFITLDIFIPGHASQFRSKHPAADADHLALAGNFSNADFHAMLGATVKKNDGANTL